MNSCAVLPSLVAVVCCLSTLFPSKENARNESRAEKISHPAIYFIRLNDTFWPSRAVKKTAHAPGRTETNVGYRGGPLYITFSLLEMEIQWATPMTDRK